MSQGNTVYHDALKKLVETPGRHAQALDIIAARIKKPQRSKHFLRGAILTNCREHEQPVSELTFF
jgi:hypothetical protein